MTTNNISKTVCVRKSMAAIFLLVLIFAGCAAPETVKPMQPGGAEAAAKVRMVQPGDFVDIHFLCRLKTGEVVAATETVHATDRKSIIFVARKGAGPLSIAAVRHDEPLSDRLQPKPFDEEILERLMRKAAGMKEGEKRRVELTATMIKPQDEQSGVARLSRVRTRPKEMKIPRSEYEFRVRKSPEVGQSFAVDPAFPGRVESVSDREVAVRFAAKPGSVIETPFGSGRIREEGANYKIDIDAREGSLVRTGNRIGRISKVDEKVITVDYRHPFGYEALICDVTVNRVTEAEAKKDGAGKK